MKQDWPTSPLHMLEIELVKACRFSQQEFVVILLKWLTVERLIQIISVDEGPPPSRPKILHLVFKIQHGLAQAFLASFPSSKHWPSSCPPHVSRGLSLTVHTKHHAFSSRVWVQGVPGLSSWGSFIFTDSSPEDTTQGSQSDTPPSFSLPTHSSRSQTAGCGPQCRGWSQCRGLRVRQALFRINFYWSIAASQCYIIFYCRAKWVSCTCTFVPSLLDFFPIQQAFLVNENRTASIRNHCRILGKYHLLQLFSQVVHIHSLACSITMWPPILVVGCCSQKLGNDNLNQ